MNLKYYSKCYLNLIISQVNIRSTNAFPTGGLRGPLDLLIHKLAREALQILNIETYYFWL